MAPHPLFITFCFLMLQLLCGIRVTAEISNPAPAESHFFDSHPAVLRTQADSPLRLLEANSQESASVFWSDEKAIAFEKQGTIQLSVLRSGDLSSELAVPLSIQFVSATATDFGPLPASVTFPPGASNAAVNIALQNDFLTEGRESVLIRLGEPSATNAVVTRPELSLVLLDDETPGTLDPLFAPPISPATGVPALRQRPDGKILVSASGNGANVLLLNPDGSLDDSFVTNGIPSSGPAEIRHIELLPSGKMYVSGFFNTQTSGYGINHLARLNPDGTLDTNFNPHISGGRDFYASSGVDFALQPDGKLIASRTGLGTSIRFEGDSFSPNPQPVRLNPDGSRDRSFSMDSAYKEFQRILLQPDGSVLVCATTNLAPGVFRHTSSGRTDPTFAVRTGIGKGALDDCEIAGDAVLVAGSFMELNGLPVKYLARVRLSDGAVDTNFVVNADGPVFKVRNFGDKLYIAGSFTNINGADRFRFACLNPDGSLDPDFDPGLEFTSAPSAIEAQPDGRLLVSGYFERVDSFTVPKIVRLEAVRSPGEVRLLNQHIVLNESGGVAVIDLERVGGSSGTVSARIQTIDGSALAGRDYIGTNLTVTWPDGDFARKTIEIPVTSSEAASGDRTFAIRVDAGNLSREATVLIKDEQDGSFDSTFLPRLIGGTNMVRDFAVTSEGKVYLAGDFTSLNGFAITNLARLNADLTLDTNFSLAMSPNAPIDAIALRPSGEILFGGAFLKVGTSNWPYLAQANANGSFDLPFMKTLAPTVNAIGLIRDLELQPDGKLLTAPKLRRVGADGKYETLFRDPAGTFKRLAVHPDGFIYAATDFDVQRFASNGAPDSGVSSIFRLSTGGQVNVPVESLAMEPDGTLLIGGQFNQLNSFPAVRTARLGRVLPDGKVDTNFISSIGADAASLNDPKDTVLAILPLPGGDILAGGNFHQVGSEPRSLIARLAPNGELREDFHPEIQGSSVSGLALLPDGRVLARGSFTNVNGTDVNGLAALRLVEPLPPVVRITSPADGASFSFGDALSPLEFSVDAFDPDGFLNEVRLELDGMPIATNTAGHFTAFQFPPAEGDHTLSAIATDTQGLSSTNSIVFHVTYVPFFSIVNISLGSGGVTIQFSGTLQSSDDLKTWTDLSGLTSPAVIPLSEPRRFYRSRL